MTPGIVTENPQSPVSSVDAFDAWAEVYDGQRNPLLALEQRLMASMLPDVRGLDVLDAGCGTGRWLEHLAAHGARSMTGVDISPAMLRVAAAKLAGRCDLRSGNCTSLPVADASADLILASFVVSYLDDLRGFAAEMYRAARPGATIFISDMHPETEAACNWKRSVTSMRAGPKLYRWTREQVAQSLQAQGLERIAENQPAFGPEERPIFDGCGKLDAYDSIGALPAIYVMQWRKPARSPRSRSAVPGAEGIVLSGGRCTLGPETAARATLSIVGDTIDSIGHDSSLPWLGNAIDLSGFLLLPGLINAHDHLEFGLYPNIGSGPYENAAHWAQDIHARWAPLIAQHRQVPRSTRLWWGALRNLLCGATTVCHHNPIHAELLDPAFPIRVVKEISWAHSAAFDPRLAQKFAESDLPFVVHAAEGVDEASEQEIEELDRMQALSHRTVLVHGLACSPEAVSLMNQRRSALIVCPTSNEYLFYRSPSLAFLRSLDAVILGTDSPLTAAGDLLDEINFVHKETGLDPGSLYTMVTTRTAQVLRLHRGEGTLKAGAVADLVVVRDAGLSPAATLAVLTSQEIELVIVGGQVQLAGASLIERLPRSLRRGLQKLDVEGQTRWVRAPIDHLLAEAEMVLGSDLRVGGKRVRRASAA